MTSRVLVALRIEAPPERVFAAFVDEIDRWWRHNGLFEFSRGRAGRMAFEPGLGGRLTETYEDGSVFEVGQIRTWEPPSRLVLGWRQASFSDRQETEVHICFEQAGDETRVTVEHFGWDTIPQDHVARHGFPLFVFQQRHAEWWRTLLDSLRERVSAPRGR